MMKSKWPKELSFQGMLCRILGLGSIGLFFALTDEQHFSAPMVRQHLRYGSSLVTLQNK